MRKKVGLAIVTYTINYGTYLQAFATQTVIRKLGYPTEIINIASVEKDVSKARRKYFFKQLLNISEVRSYRSTVEAIIKRKVNANYREYFSCRENCFKAFNKKYFDFGPVCDSWSGLHEHCFNYSTVVVGSDQLWRPANIAGNFYTLNFVPNEINKVSYATSFGLSTIRDNQREDVNKFLSRINYLSCREESGIKIIKDLTKRDAKLVCDPTLLLSKQEWNVYLPVEPIVSGDYILIYLLSSNQEHREYVKRLAKITNCKIVGVLHGAGYVKGDEKFVDEAPNDIGPFEFLNLIRNAKYVCTDSFHGCVFSTIFERDFYAFKRFSDKDKMSTNSRVSNLLNRLGLQNRLYDGRGQVDLTSIDYDVVNRNVVDFREESLSYLMNALDGGKKYD